MPVTLTERPLGSSRLRVQPRALGGYDRADRPNPNDPLETLKRRNPNLQYGTSSQFDAPQANAPMPTVTGTGESALSANLALQQRAREHTLRYNAGETARRAEAGNQGIAAIAPIVPQSSQWEGLLQALFEAGTDRVRTGARAGWQAPGFYDTQTQPMTRAQNTMSPREVLLMQEMQRQPRRR